MIDKREAEQRHDQQRAFAQLIRAVSALIETREAANPTPRPPPEHRGEMPGALIAAEKDVLRCQVIGKIQAALCGDPEECRHGRCRRRKRCTESEEIGRLMQEARAALAREQAVWQPRPTPSQPPARQCRRVARAERG